MSAAQVRLLRRAQGDLIELQQYFSRESPAAADRIVEGLLTAIESLAAHPLKGAVPMDERLAALGFRFLVKRRYIVFYKATRTRVTVYRVLHARREYRTPL